MMITSYLVGRGNAHAALIVGGGPSALDTYRRVRASVCRCEPVDVFTCNAGIYLARRPDFIVLMDIGGANLFRYHIREAVVRGGSRLLCACEEAESIIFRHDHPSMYDIHRITPEPSHVTSTVQQSTPYTSGVTTGLLAMQIAFEAGFSDIHMVGFDGYRSGQDGLAYVDNFDGRIGPLHGHDYQRRIYDEHTRELIQRDPSVRFIWHGPTSYDVMDLPNVEQEHSGHGLHHSERH